MRAAEFCKFDALQFIGAGQLSRCTRGRVGHHAAVNGSLERILELCNCIRTYVPAILHQFGQHGPSAVSVSESPRASSSSCSNRSKVGV